MSARLFGTDGVRGVAGTWPLDPPTVARLGAAIVRAGALGRPTRLIVGRDTRESGVWIERELARGATAEHAVVVSAGVVPTPAIAYLAGAFDFDLGVVLSASHNPYHDNGIKVFSGRGEKFGEPEERRVELVMADSAWAVPDSSEPHIEHAALVQPYLDHVRRLLPSAGTLRGSRVAVDMAHGATTATAARLFEDLGFDLVRMGDAPNGRNINLGCGSTHPEALGALVRDAKCRLGVAFDGDGDRVILIDEAGHVVDGDAVLLTLATAYQRAGRLAGDTVVATVMSNLGLEVALAAKKIRLVRTPVGDKYVMDEMLRGGFVLGGEQSGHVILTGHLPTGDGLATALAIMGVMIDTGRELSSLAADLVRFPQTLVNLRVRERIPIDDLPTVIAVVRRVEAAAGDRGRVLVRYSGTEPLLRVMIEGEDRATIDGWAAEIIDAARTAIGEAPAMTAVPSGRPS